MARVSFDSVFQINQDGTIQPRQIVRIAGVTLSPEVRLRQGVSIGGIDISQFRGRDLEIQTSDGVTVVTGIY